jgi:hypothetical protein
LIAGDARLKSLVLMGQRHASAQSIHAAAVTSVRENRARDRLSRAHDEHRRASRAGNSSRSVSAHFTRQKPLSKMVSFVFMPWERQATYQHRQVSYHRQDAGGVHSTAEVVDLQQLNVDHQNWHRRG